jgi:hypothetical protein
MKKFHVILAGLTFLSLALTQARADDLERLAGKWSVNKTNDQGQAFTQTIEVKKDKLTFKIVGTDGTTYLHATGDIKLEKCGSFSVMKVTNIKAGRSESELEPVDDDRSSVYQLGYDTWTMASNFDKEREQKPGIDVYRKSAK